MTFGVGGVAREMKRAAASPAVVVAPVEVVRDGRRRGQGGGGVRASTVAVLRWVSGLGEGTGRCGRARGVRRWSRGRRGGRSSSVGRQWRGGGTRLRRAIEKEAGVLGRGFGAESVEGREVYIGEGAWRRGRGDS